MMLKRSAAGVSCYILPKKDFVQKQAMAVVRFGSDISGFTADNVHFDVPAGTAHFMEHLMFAAKDKSLMDEFTSQGAEANAFTAFDRTAYYFTCTDNFYKNLETLVKMISVPYFTKDGIDSERKIITQEINMYKDDARWQCYFSALKCLYPDRAVSNEIAGDAESIAKIDEDILHTCFDHFYNTANIAVIAAGDIDAERVCECVEKNAPTKTTLNVKTDKYKKISCGRKFTQKNMDISMPYFYVGFKEESLPLSAPSIVKMRVMLEAMAGECSRLYAKLLDIAAVDDPPGFEYLKGRNYGAGLIFGEAAAPEKTAEYILKEIENISRSGFENAAPVIKKQRGDIIMQTESVNGICMPIADCFAKNIDFLDILEFYDKIDIDGLHFSLPDDIAVSIVNAKNKAN